MIGLAYKNTITDQLQGGRLIVKGKGWDLNVLTYFEVIKALISIHCEMD